MYPVPCDKEKNIRCCKFVGKIVVNASRIVQSEWLVGFLSPNHRRTGLKNLGGLRQNLWAYSKFWGLIFGSLVSNVGLFGPKKGPLLKSWAYLGSKKRSSTENWGLSKCWGLGQGGGCSPPQPPLPVRLWFLTLTLTLP